MQTEKPIEPVCRWCGETREQHVESLAPDDPRPRVPCLGLRSNFLPRSTSPELRRPGCNALRGPRFSCECGAMLPQLSLAPDDPRERDTMIPPAMPERELLSTSDAVAVAMMLERMLNKPTADLMVVAAACAHRGQIDLADLVLGLARERLGGPNG